MFCLSGRPPPVLSCLLSRFVLTLSVFSRGPPPPGNWGQGNLPENQQTKSMGPTGVGKGNPSGWVGWGSVGYVMGGGNANQHTWNKGVHGGCVNWGQGVMGLAEAQGNGVNGGIRVSPVGMGWGQAEGLGV